MGKFHGAIGYAVFEEHSPGNVREKIVERLYDGDLVRNTRNLQGSEGLNDNLNIANEISIVADPFAYSNFHSMQYVDYMGAKWKVKKVEVAFPRLILTVGDVYNEPKTKSSK